MTICQQLPALKKLFSILSDFFDNLGIAPEYLHSATTASAAFVMAILCVALYFFILVPIAVKIAEKVEKSKSTYDDLLISPKFMRSICIVVMAVIVRATFPSLTLYYPQNLLWVTKICELAVIAAVSWMLIIETKAFCEYLRMRDIMRSGLLVFRNILETVVLVVAGLLAVSTIMNRELAYVISALGAMAAVLMLVFRDSILGMIAGIRLTMNGMMKENDWVSVPKYNADGRVEDITLTAVKIRNWDKSVATIPPYALVTEGFINRQRMLDLGIRQLKRLFYIDVNTVRHLSPEEAASFENEEWAKDIDLATPQVNLSLFRRFLRHKMLTHPLTAKSTDPAVRYQVIVKEMPATPTGIPIELFFFLKCLDWETFEELQADFIDEVTASFPLFHLRLYQSLTHSDFSAPLR